LVFSNGVFLMNTIKLWGEECVGVAGWGWGIEMGVGKGGGWKCGQIIYLSWDTRIYINSVNC
jgi:hypothetical protein